MSAVSGTPKLQAIYSEAEQWLLPTGDGSYANGNEMSVSYMGNCGAASLSRVNAYSIRSPGLIVSRLIQGGQRFQAITLTTPGTVILRGLAFDRALFHRTKSILDPRTNFRGAGPILVGLWITRASSVAAIQRSAKSGTLGPTRSKPTRFRLALCLRFYVNLGGLKR